MDLLAPPTTLVHRDYGRKGALAKAPAWGRRVVVYAGGEPVGAYKGLGLDPFSAILGVVSNIIGGDQQASAERYAANQRLKEAQLASRAQETGYRYAFAAEQSRSESDVTKTVLQANAALSALRTQRAAQIDSQATQLVANTENGIFRLSSAGVVEASASTQAMAKRAMWGTVLVAGLILFAISNPRIGGKKIKLGGKKRPGSAAPGTSASEPTSADAKAAPA